MASIYAAMVVINAEGRYVDIVQMYDPQGNKLDHPYQYGLASGEKVIDARKPPMRQHAGTTGFIDPVWDEEATAWIEAATDEEIAAWEAEHPAPEMPEPQPSTDEILDILLGVS